VALVALVMAAWLALLAGVARHADAAAQVVVLFPSSRLMAHLPLGAAITGRSALSLTLRSDNAGLVADLYHAGAWLVLPAGLQGCIVGPGSASPRT